MKSIYILVYKKNSVCLYVCVGSAQKLLTIHVKTAEGIIMKFHI